LMQIGRMGLSNCFQQKAKVILLLDAYQPESKAGFIFYSLVMESCILMILCYPGNLRESRSGAKGLILLL
jgi:hypothetical protein